MRTQARHHLKQDQFTATANEAMSWTVEHREKLIWGTGILAVVLAMVLGGWWYMQSQEQSAAVTLGHAIGVYTTPLTPGAQPPAGTTTSFATVQQRAKAAKDEFQKVADKYGRTKSGHIAKYFVGLTDIDLNNNSDAERALKEVAGSGKDDIAALAKMALASVYRSTGRDKEAISLYKELADKPSNAVSKPAAQLQMAETYEATDPQNARIVYQQIQKESPQSAAAELAAQKLASLK